MDLLETLRGLEIELHQPATRADRQKLDALLHEDFEEIGRSGALYTKQDILAQLPVEDPPTIWVQDFVVTELGPNVALLRYRSAHEGADGNCTRHTLRSSLWVNVSGCWQIRFHQGTATAPWVIERLGD
ncbi:MAG: nuclear transport factor 2 family protein [Caldilineaceae bacterium]